LLIAEPNSATDEKRNSATDEKRCSDAPGTVRTHPNQEAIVKTIPTCIARAHIGETTMSVYRTPEGRLAFEPAEGAALELYDSVDDVVERVPDELAQLVRAKAARAGAR
jgi:hypothetical protein